MSRCTRRVLLATGAVSLSVGAQEAFPPTTQAGGRTLVRNGIGARVYSIFSVEVYRAALYLEAPSRDADQILAARGPRLIVARYNRDVPLEAVSAAWEQSVSVPCRCPLPPAFRAWLRPIAAGSEERFLFLADEAITEGPGRPPAQIEGAAESRRLLAAWIGPAAPTEALRRGLLGQDRSGPRRSET